MTDKLIEQIKKDREAGTPDPVRAELSPEGYWSVWGGRQFSLCMANCGPDENAFSGGNARRIARVPDMEARIEADAEVIKAAEVLVQRINGWASDNIMEDNCRDWLGHVEPALAAFRQAQARAAKGGE